MPNPIAILGDFNPSYSTHRALNESIHHLKESLSQNAEFQWVGTETITADSCSQYSGLWIAPGSPYNNMSNVLDAIASARTGNIPTLGNCGGFQHMLIEFARNVCGIPDADHEETNTNTKEPLISRLSCSLVGEQETVILNQRDSRLYSIVRQDAILGKYYCNYGLNPKYISLLESHGLILTARSETGEVRAFELLNHPFYMGTLFQPALTSVQGTPNPILIEFVNACLHQ